MISEFINLDNRSYPVYIGEDILKDAGKLIKKISPENKKILLVSDTNVYSAYGPECIKSLEYSGFDVAVLMIAAGEENKNIDTLQLIFDKAISCELDRKSLFMALGGGVVGDITGFAAATFMRGVPFVQIPTSLLAMVDSSVGGKTAINHPRGKNLIGAFYQPKAVLADIKTLQTLPRNEYLAGLAEVIKYGLIGDWDFFHWFNENTEFIINKKDEYLIHAIKTSVRNKARIVESDEEEKDRRRLLNLGHTFGHALEAATAYKYYIHGEAVLIGMNMAVKLSESLGLLDGLSVEKIKKLLSSIKFKEPPPGLKTEEVTERLFLDKKREGKDIIFVLPKSNSEAVIYKNPPEETVSIIINDYLEKQ